MLERTGVPQGIAGRIRVSMGRWLPHYDRPGFRGYARLSRENGYAFGRRGGGEEDALEVSGNAFLARRRESCKNLGTSCRVARPPLRGGNAVLSPPFLLGGWMGVSGIALKAGMRNEGI